MQEMRSHRINAGHSWPCSVSFYSEVLKDWSSTAASVQISEVINNCEAQVVKAANLR